MAESRRLSTPKKSVSTIRMRFLKTLYRWLLHNKDKNGFGRCVRRIGRKILLDLDELEAWIDTNRGSVVNRRV